MYPELIKFKALEQKKDLQAVNLGTGMGYYDFVYEGISDTAFNMALPQQNLEFDYWMLKEFQGKIRSGAKILLVLPFCIFCANWFEELRYVYTRYYSLLPNKIVSPYAAMSYKEYLEWNYGQEDGVTEDTPAARQREEDMGLQSCQAIRNWERQLHLDFSRSEMVSDYARKQIEESKVQLRKILDFCDDKSFCPVIVIPPMCSILLDMISQEFRENHFYNPLYEVIKGKMIKVLDYSRDKEFCIPELYSRPEFLRKDVAGNFTRDVLKEIGLEF